MHIPESDWKQFKPVRDKALDVFCERVLLEVASTLADGALSNHDKFLQVYATTNDRNRELGRIFDGYSRSGALLQLTMMQSSDLLDAKDIDDFSESTKEHLSYAAQLERDRS